MNRGFEDWFFSSCGKEKKIVEHLASFLKSKTSNSEIFTLVKGLIKPNNVIIFSPDIDVLEIDSNKKLTAYEIKLLKGKKKEYFVGDVTELFDAEKKKQIQTVRELSKTDPAIYTGLGEALFNLLNADMSYLVTPKPVLTCEFESLIKILSIGLIIYDKDLNFSVKKEAPALSGIYPTHKNDILKSDKDKPKYPHFVTQRGKLWFSKRI